MGKPVALLLLGVALASARAEMESNAASPAAAQVSGLGKPGDEGGAEAVATDNEAESGGKVAPASLTPAVVERTGHAEPMKQLLAALPTAVSSGGSDDAVSEGHRGVGTEGADDGLLIKPDGSITGEPDVPASVSGMGEGGSSPSPADLDSKAAAGQPTEAGLPEERTVSAAESAQTTPSGSEISGEDDLGPITREEEQAIARMMAAAMDVTARAHGGKTALHLAAQEGKAAMVLALIEKGALVNAEDQDDFTPLHDAAAAGKTDAVLVLLEHSARVNASSLYGFTPLHLAADGGFTATALVLLDKGAKIEAVTSNELTPLHCAVINRHTDTAEALIRRGANVQAEDTNGATPLHYAAAANDANMVRMLLSHKADINDQGNDGNSPLHVAAYDGTVAMVKLLLERGANPHLQNAEGYTPLQLAEQMGNKQKAKLLREAMGKPRH